MKILKEELYNTLEFIVELRKTSIKDIDFSDVLGQDLTKEQKDTYFWVYERRDPLDAIIEICQKHGKK